MRPVKIALITTLAVIGAGCAGSSAKVVSSSGALPVQAVQLAPANGPLQRIAVTAFEFKAGQGSREIGDGMTDMLTDALVNTGRFIVVERERLGEVTAEQDLANSDRFAKETAAPKGQLEGAQLLIRGSVTQFEPNCAGGSALIVSGKQACMAINLRIIDARTGRVVNATTVEGTSGKGSVGLVFGDLPIGLGAYKKTPMEAAIRNCIETAVKHIVETKL